MTPLDPEYWSNEENLLWSAVVGVFVDALLDGVQGGVEALPPDVSILTDFDTVNQSAIDYARSYRYEWISGINNTSRRQVQQLISDWILSGEPLNALEAKLSPIFGSVRANMIAVTEVTRVFAEANQAAWQSTGMVGGKMWMTAMDDRVCPICAPMNGVDVGLTNAFPNALGGGYKNPPAHVGCLTGDALILPVGGVSAGSERWYEGDIITIETAENNLTVTPNHPILTPAGWVAAKDLVRGDNVFCYTGGERIAAGTIYNNNDCETKIKDIFCSLSLPGFRMPTSAPDFHGDGANSDVAIIRPNSEVVNNRQASGRQPFAEHSFSSGMDAPLSGLRAGDEFFSGNNPSLSNVMGGGDLGSAFLGAHPAPFGEFSLGLATDMDTRIYKALAECATIDTSLASQLIFGLSGLITSQQVFNIRNDYLSGHVYNLQTESGLYIANKIVTHNCRCWLQPVVSVDKVLERIERILAQ